MVLEDDKGTGGFSFIWTIQNFSYCLQQNGESLLSPSFAVDALGKDKWCISLYPRGSNLHKDMLSVYLRRIAFKHFPLEVNFVISIRTIKGTFKKFEVSKDIFAEISGHGVPNFLTLAQLFEKGVYLENDALTVQCRMWRSTVDPSASEK